ncbi:MAG TPA: glycine oxidase ThiO [Ktedonobacteraceae bacterium]|nr:glycine oxidase ThiO [Ktedonobacteraceae bacterium]
MVGLQASTDVIIVGGGVIGCSIAYYLRKAGVEVIVLEQGDIGAQASSAAAGLLAPLGSLSGPGPFADLLLASWSMFPTLMAELEDVSGIRMEYARTGALRVVRNPKSSANLRKRMQEWQPLGLQMYWLSGDEARQREPLLAPDICAAIYAPEESQVKAPLVVKAFAKAAEKMGAKLYSQSEVLGVRREHDTITGVYTTQGETIACNHLVIASGAWAAESGIWLNLPLPVTPQRGQILTLRQPTPPLRHIIFGEAIYLAPKFDKTVVVGATKEEVGFHKQGTAGGVSWLLNSAIRLATSFDGSAIEQMWAGLRPKTPDNLPILGSARQWQNVTLALGHGCVGIMLSAITGQSIAELVVSGSEPELMLPFSVERFGETRFGHLATRTGR